MFSSFFSWVKRYERHLSAGAIFVGFVTDSIFLTRVDVLGTHLVFASYTILCFVSIALLHFFESRASRGRGRPRIASLLPIVTQFALGGFWSGFVIFYGRSAELGTSWPFLLILLLVIGAGEYFHEYHSRLVFTSTLFFFALYSYALFAVPIYTGSIGVTTFLLSGAVAIGVFFLFTMLLRLVAYERFARYVWRVRAGALGVVLLVNLFYFTNILPPLPLSAEASGVYHAVVRTPGVYTAFDEHHPWPVRILGFTPTFHLPQGGSLAAYSAIFAPTELRTNIVHRWEWYDETRKVWETQARVPYPIVGGRDSGYRGYSQSSIVRGGSWRVSIETEDGRRVARLPFRVVFVSAPPELEATRLK